MTEQETPKAYRVTLHDFYSIVFTYSNKKARWAAVAGYREAYGNDGSWPCPREERVPQYDKAWDPGRHKIGICYMEGWLNATYPAHPILGDKDV